MTNREWLDKMNNEELGESFCEEVAQDGEYCKTCRFSKYSDGSGRSCFTVWLEQEYKNK